MAAAAAARRSGAQRGSQAGGSGAAAMAPAAGSSSAGSLPWGPPPAGHTQQTVRGQRVSQGADPTFMALNGGSLWRLFISAAQTEESSKHLPDDWGQGGTQARRREAWGATASEYVHSLILS